ncbi:CMP-N-acetylneuraminate-poly-alpha-2,8-sialyltransferase-like isoform X2 [Patiria miniata]|uniref:Uncharacterized protein n=1 Tax=Patiria miniata TaxID=46514 RepID=A0A914BS73_PATMI|nr:CMP-N-acetylneuraminate-poly-alpha-2,8-sialyltransferase-like isoform X2 [Patiria miniata]
MELYPQHAWSYRSQRHSSERRRHVSSSRTSVNVTYSSISRWAVLRCKRTVLSSYRTILLVSVLAPMTVALLLLRPSAYALQDELGHILTVQGIQDNAYISTTNSSWRFLTPVTALQPNGSSVNATQQTVKVTPNTNSFAQKYANHYCENDTDFLFDLHDIMDRKWRKNVTNLEEFRNDLRAALGDKASLNNFILTRQNTKAGARINFVYNGGSVKVSSVFWKSLASEKLYRSGLYNRCSVVGSSGILNGSGCGHNIDTADFVFRFNLADVNDYAVDVGSKINFTTLNPSILYAKLNALKKKADRETFADMLKQFRGSHLWLPAFAFRWKYQVLVKAADVARSSKYVQPIYGHPQHYDTVAKLWKDTLNGTERTTTGFHVISSIFDLCDQIDVYGFWPFKTSLEGAAVPYHYHDKINATSAHSFSKEFKALVALHDRGIIQLHVGSCL